MMITHPIIFIVVILLLGVIINEYIRNGTIIHGLGFLGAIYISVFVVDYLCMSHSFDYQVFIIKKPVKKELIIISICTILGLIFLCVRYIFNWNGIGAILKLSVLPLMLFVFPIVLSLVYLFIFKYPLKNLGINLNYWYLPILINIVFGLITLIFAPEKSHWHLLVSGTVGNLFSWLFTGLIGAALSEEFTRMLFQTRIKSLSNNMAIGWISAAFIWALLHFPVFSQEHVEKGWRAVIMATLNLIPLGLLWGYITYRTKSIIPSVVIHGLNLWGLQNF